MQAHRGRVPAAVPRAPGGMVAWGVPASIGGMAELPQDAGGCRWTLKAHRAGVCVWRRERHM